MELVRRPQLKQGVERTDNKTISFATNHWKHVLALPAIYLLVHVSASAQQTSDATQAIQTITVTANKREQSVQDVASSISAFSADQLKDLGVANVIDLAKVTPGLNFGGSFGGQNLSLSIRGVVQSDFAATAEGPNGTYIDDGYVGLTNVMGIGLFDIKSAEVLKGPQGTLFGRNATGGVVSISTANPSSTREGFIDYTRGSYSTNRLEFGVGGPLSEVINGRISGLYKSNDSYITNVNPTGGNLGDFREWGLRGKLDIKTSDTSNVLLTGFSTRSASSWGPYFNETSLQVFDANRNQVNSIISPTPGPLGTVPSDPKNMTLNANAAQSTGNFTEMNGFQAKVRLRDALGGSITSITDFKSYKSRLSIDNDASTISFIDFTGPYDFKQISQELRYFRVFDSARLTAGVYYLKMDGDISPDKNVLGAAFGGIIGYDYSHLDTTASAVFGQYEYDLTPKVMLVGGLRYTNDKKDFTYRSEGTLLDGTPIGTLRGAYTGSSDNNLVTGKLQVEYRPQAQTMLYASYNRGAKAGSFNVPYFGGTAYPDSEMRYKPEKIDAYEAGAKVDLLDGKMRVNGAVFYYDYKDFQAFKFIGLSSEVVNRPARTKGAELEIVAKPARGLTLSASGSYTDNIVRDVSMGAIVADRVAPYTSKWRGMAGARYEWPAFNGKMAANLDVQYTGSYFYALTNYDATRAGGYSVGSARVSWSDAPGKWTVSAFVDNLADKRYKTVGFDAALYGFAQVAYGKPRWFGVEVGNRF